MKIFTQNIKGLLFLICLIYSLSPVFTQIDYHLNGILTNGLSKLSIEYNEINVNPSLINNQLTSKDSPRKLPEGYLVIGYCSDLETDDKILEAVDNGANVIIWFSLYLESKNNLPFINDRGLNYNLIAEKVRQIKQKYPDKQISHLISIGGWNAPHISTSFDANTWYTALDYWNKRTVVREGFLGFDGFDFDLEGSDNTQGEYSHFTKQELDLIGQLSQRLKANGFIVTLVPAQSYFDYEENGFSLNLNISPSWKNFPYAGKNSYAYIWQRYYNLTKDLQSAYNLKFSYDETNINTETFDLLSLQIYEGWSRANYNISNNIKAIENYFKDLVNGIVNGWTVKFSEVAEMEYSDAVVRVPLNKLALGLANGWANADRGGKFLLLWKEELERAFKELSKEKLLPRGWFYWTIASEGTKVKDNKGEEIEYYLTSYLSEFSKVFGEEGKKGN